MTHTPSDLSTRALPAPLAAGAKVRIVAPSGPFDEAPFERGVELLAGRYAVEWDPSVLGRRVGYLAGTDRERREELQRALDDPELDALWLARGGYGLGRIVGELDWTGFRQHPKWFVGFSDGTLLHLALAAQGICSLHAANVTGLSHLPAADCATTFDLLEGRSGTPLAARRLDGEGTPVPRVPILGGNLTVLFTEVAAGRAPRVRDHFVFLEDVTETSYRVDRMLTALRPLLGESAGIVLGDFTDCSPGRFAVSVESVLHERLLDLGVPVLTVSGVGHGERNHPFVHGAPLWMKPLDS